MMSRFFIAVTIAGAAAGAVATVALRNGNAGTPVGIAALERPRKAGDEIVTNLPLARAGYELGTSRRVAHDFYVLERGPEVCMLRLRRPGASAGCAPKGDFFGRRALAFGADNDGHPANPTSLTFYGIGRPDVAAVRIRFARAERTVSLNADHAFVYEADEATLEAGRIVAVEALRRDGSVIESTPGPTDQ